MMYRISLSRRRNMKLIYGKTGMRFDQFPSFERASDESQVIARPTWGRCHCLGFPSGYDMPR